MKSQKNVLVCVTAQESSKALVAAGKAIAEKYGATVEVISILPTQFNKEKAEPQVLDRLYTYSKSVGASFAVFFSDDPALTAAVYISKTKPQQIVVGFPGEESCDFIGTIQLLIPDLVISMVDGDKIYNILPRTKRIYSQIEQK